jgi:hypothetical protein
MPQATDLLKVFISSQESRCDACGDTLGRWAWITLTLTQEALCLACADLDHLIFLPAGDAALTRRARKYATLSALVLQWSRARKRYERQGVLVEEAALAQAEADCLADSDVRARRRQRAATREAELDRHYVERFSAQVRTLFPGCPPDRDCLIGEHACQKYSGRVGRSAAAKQLGDEAVRLAVIAHIRHAETPYDTLLAQGEERWSARARVEPAVTRVLRQWEAGRG